MAVWLCWDLAAVVFFFSTARPALGAATEDEDASDAIQDIDNLVHDAVRKLHESSLGRGASLGKLPVVFVLGESDSAKTHTIVNSSLDPELLAGHVYQDNQILPTQTVNFWYIIHEGEFQPSIITVVRFRDCLLLSESILIVLTIAARVWPGGFRGILTCRSPLLPPSQRRAVPSNYSSYYS